MAEQTSKVLEGVFAISKPPSVSSAQVIRNLQLAFANSKTFAPLREQTKHQQAIEPSRAKRRKISKDNVFKMGHGGTLDPMATGVLIVGIGRGTKRLQDFLHCTKTYETVVLFGKSTDTYDVAGKIVGDDLPYDHIKRAQVEEKLVQFRGKIKQVPPVYSALRIDGIKAYEYARTGKDLPRELESREMNVSECEIIEWYDKGDHDFRWPAIEASEEEKSAMKKLMRGAEETVHHEQETASGTVQASSATPLPPTSTSASEKPQSEADSKQSPSPPKSAKSLRSSKSPSREEIKSLNALPAEAKAAKHTHTITTLSSTAATAPAVRIRLTVTSGFYVRSFAHDLGIACGSYATMAELARTRQAGFTSMPGSIPTSSATTDSPDSEATISASTPALADSTLTETKGPDVAVETDDAPPNTGDQEKPESRVGEEKKHEDGTGLVPALTFGDLEAGEGTWGPKLRRVLEAWVNENPAPNDHQNGERRDRADRADHASRSKRNWTQRGNSGKRAFEEDNGGGGRRRNSSSPE